MMKMTTSGDGEWELRPGGMVVQKRIDHSSNVPRVIRVRVKYGSVLHEISINSQSTFGELKKILSSETEVHHQDMKIFHKNKERDSMMFLDLSGVKDRSKLILKLDPFSQEKRLLVMRKIAAKEKSSRAISDLTSQVERLAGQLSVFDKIIGKGEKIVERNLENMMEMLMNQLVKLDAISGDKDVQSKKKMLVERSQKYVEKLDLLKIKNSTQPKPQTQLRLEEGDLLTYEEETWKKSTASSSAPPVIITTTWETFDSISTSTTEPQTVKLVHPKFKWELFD